LFEKLLLDHGGGDLTSARWQMDAIAGHTAPLTRITEHSQKSLQLREYHWPPDGSAAFFSSHSLRAIRSCLSPSR
jgi:hypothetical protein